MLGVNAGSRKDIRCTVKYTHGTVTGNGKANSTILTVIMFASISVFIDRKNNNL